MAGKSERARPAQRSGGCIRVRFWLTGKPGRAALAALALAGAAVPLWAWETVYQANQLLVQRRPYQGSALQEFQGRTRLNASLDAVLALLQDAGFNQQWVYRSGGATILARVGDTQAYVHGIVDAPWPMQDRDAVVRFDARRQPVTGEITINISNFPEFIPSTEQFVRVPDFGGFWHLKQLPDGQVEVTYRVHGDPGGCVPVPIANYAAATSVIRTLGNMDDALQRHSTGN
jgi:hypothetical protein